MKKFSETIKEEQIEFDLPSTEEPITEAVKKSDSSWHTEKAKFHREAASFFKEGGLHDRAKYHNSVADDHEAQSNV